MPSFKLPKAPSFRKPKGLAKGSSDLADRAAEDAQAQASGAAADAQGRADKAAADAKEQAEKQAANAKEQAEKAAAEAKEQAEKAAEEARLAAEKAAAEAQSKFAAMFDPSTMVDQIDEVKDKVQEVLEDVGDKFSELAKEMTGAIDLDPVKEKIDGVLGSLKQFADDPSKVLGSAAAMKCCFPMAAIKNTVEDLCGTITDIASGFGAMQAMVGMINELVGMLEGIGDKVKGTVEALGDLPDLLDFAKEALTGDGDPTSASEAVDGLMEKASLKSTAASIDGLVERMAKLTNSPELDAVKQMVTSIVTFIQEAPGRLREIATPNVLIRPCVSLPDQVKQLIDMIEGFAAIFSADPINKVLEFASANKEKEEETPSLAEPMGQIEDSLEGLSKMLKLRVSTPRPSGVPTSLPGF